MHHHMKVTLFRQRRYTITEPPTTPTWRWTEIDWIQWIDKHGQWHPVEDSALLTKVAFGHLWEYDPKIGTYRRVQKTA